MSSDFERLQAELQQTAVALLVEARASALALSLEEDLDGYWVAIGPKSHIPLLLGNPTRMPQPEIEELARHSRGLGRDGGPTLQ
jgi:hypothetical protein